jgi:hypothetical protein
MGVIRDTLQLEIPLEEPLKRQVELREGPGTFINELKSCWHEVTANASRRFDIRFSLWPVPEENKAESKTRWVPVSLLIHILTFIEGIRSKKIQADITVELFPTGVIKTILEPEHPEVLTMDLLKKVVSLVRFYAINQFPELIATAGASTIPSATYFEFIREDLKVDIPRSLPYLVKPTKGSVPEPPPRGVSASDYSSTMMPLVSLVNTPLENSALAHRLGNVKNILRNQIYREKQSGRPYDLDKAERKAEIASTIFMFELAANIYQHAFAHLPPAVRVCGYTAAQIVRFPQGQDAQIHLKTFARLKGLSSDEFSHTDLSQQIRFLSLIVSDFGIGIVDRVRSDLNKKRQKIKQMVLPLGDAAIAERAQRLQQWLENASDYDAHQLLVLAATTPYTSKADVESLSSVDALRWLERDKDAIDDALKGMEKAAKEQQDWEEVVEILDGKEVLRHILHPAGFGLGYCLLFVVRHFGSLTMTCGNDQVTFNAREEAYEMLDSARLDLTDGLDLLQSRPDALFDIKTRTFVHENPQLDAEYPHSNDDSVPPDAEDEAQHEIVPFPGTQIQIDVPVLFRWADREPEHRAREKAWLEELHGRLTSKSY